MFLKQFQVGVFDFSLRNHYYRMQKCYTIPIKNRMRIGYAYASELARIDCARLMLVWLEHLNKGRVGSLKEAGKHPTPTAGRGSRRITRRPFDGTMLGETCRKFTRPPTNWRSTPEFSWLALRNWHICR